MHKRIKPPDRRPTAGTTIPLVVTHTVTVQTEHIGKSAANQRHGKHLTAFVWLDEDTASPGMAANDDK